MKTRFHGPRPQVLPGLILALTAWTFIGAPARADDPPVLIKTTVQIDTLRGSDYWAPGASKSVNASCWIPKVTFDVRKPIPSGAHCFISFTRPSGAAWFEFPCQISEQSDDGIVEYATPIAGDLDAFQKKYTTTPGAYGFKIRLHDELGGTDTVLLSGKFKVGRVSRSQGTPETKNDADFYVDHDWTLPIGYVWFKPGYAPDPPSLRVSTWLRGAVDLPEIAGYLYYNSKIIANTKSAGGSLDNQVSHATSDERSTDPRWSLWDLCFSNVHKTGDANAVDANPNVFVLSQNPGDYEVKVLRKGALCRDIKFTVGPDGGLVDTGIGAANKMGTGRVIVPVQVLGTLDGPWKPMAWKTDAFYGNPLTGLDVP